MEILWAIGWSCLAYAISSDLSATVICFFLALITTHLNDIKHGKVKK